MSCLCLAHVPGRPTGGHDLPKRQARDDCKPNIVLLLEGQVDVPIIKGLIVQLKDIFRLEYAYRDDVLPVSSRQ